MSIWHDRVAYGYDMTSWTLEPKKDQVSSHTYAMSGAFAHLVTRRWHSAGVCNESHARQPLPLPSESKVERRV